MVRTEADVDRLVSENQKLVHLVVNRYLKKYYVGTIEREDLISWGMIGLLQAARGWNPECGTFSTMACKAIEWMIVRGVRREWKPDQAAATMSLDAMTSGEETDGPQERFGALMAAEQNVESELLDGDTRAAVRSAVAKLSPPQRRLIAHHYYAVVPVARLAEELGLSRQTVYARQRTALRQLRGALSAAFTGGAP